MSRSSGLSSSRKVLARCARSGLAVALGLSLVSPSRAEPSTPPVELRHDYWVDGAVTLGAAGFVVGTEVAKRGLAPSRCLVCDASLNPVDRAVRGALVRRDPRPARVTSDVLAFGVVPAASFTVLAAATLSEGRGDELALDALIVAESAALALATVQIGKLSVSRLRPSARAEGVTDGNADDRLSFPSGHAASTFAFAMATGTVLTMRRHRGAPYVWVAGTMLAATASVLRVAGDKHYATDVAAGALIGSAFGVLVPILAHAPRAARALARLPLTPAPYGDAHGGGVSLQGAF